MTRLTYDQVFDRVSSCGELATFTSALGEVLRVTQDPHGKASDLAKAVSKDPALATKILRTVNSCCFGLNRTIETLEDAVVMLGFAEVERLSFAISVINHFGGKQRFAQELGQLWRHSLLCGIAAETVVEEYKLPNLNLSDVYNASLVHDIGKAVAFQVMPEVVPEILRVMEQQHKTSHEAELELLDGATHGLIGAWTVGQWGLPLGIVNSIQFHHTPLEVKDDLLLKVINVADAVCYAVAVPAIKIPGDTPPAATRSCEFLRNNEQFFKRFRDRWESRKKTIEAITK